MASSLSINVFNSGYKPIPGGPGWTAIPSCSAPSGHKDPDAPDGDATRVLDQSRRYIEDFDQTVARSSTPLEVMDLMLAKYPAYGNRYTLFAAAFAQFPS